MRGRTDEFGYVNSLFPRLLVVPPALEQKARELKTAEKNPDTSTNQPNVWRSEPWNVMVYDYMTDTNAWFLTTDVPNGLKHFVRTPMSTGMDGDFDTGNVRYKARERYSFGWSDPLGMYGSEGAA